MVSGLGPSKVGVESLRRSQSHCRGPRMNVGRRCHPGNMVKVNQEKSKRCPEEKHGSQVATIWAPPSWPSLSSCQYRGDLMQAAQGRGVQTACADLGKNMHGGNGHQGETISAFSISMATGGRRIDWTAICVTDSKA